MRWASSLRTWVSARTPRSGSSPIRMSTWHRTAVVPLRSIPSAAVRARSAMLSTLMPEEYARHDSMAVTRSPAGGLRRSQERALSRWAWGSAGAVRSMYPERSMIESPAATTPGSAGRTARTMSSMSSTSTSEPSGSRAFLSSESWWGRVGTVRTPGLEVAGCSIRTVESAAREC